MTNCLSNSTVELNKTYIFIQKYSWIDKFTTSIIIGELTVQSEPYKTLQSTAQLNRNTFLITIFELTWHHNQHLSVLTKGRHHVGCSGSVTSISDIWLT